MSRSIHIFRTPDRFIAGTVGLPGERSFFLQAARGNQLITVSLEKQQVQILAQRIHSLLEEVSRRFGLVVEVYEVDDMDPLQTPIDSTFKVGIIGLGWDSGANSVVIELLAISDKDVDESVVLDDTDEGPDAVRVFLDPISASKFASRAEKVIAAGRPTCPLCSVSIDPSGHFCIRMNGYHRDLKDDQELFSSLWDY